MKVEDYRQRLYMVALAQHRTTQVCVEGHPPMRSVEILSFDDLRWIESLTHEDISFLISLSIRG